MVSGSRICAKRVVVDARHHMLVRLASIIAKELLNGQRVVVVRCEEICLSGGLVRQKMKYLRKEQYSLQERKKLLERLVNDVDEDNEKFLLKLRNRLDRVGIDFPTVEVRFEHLNVEAEAFEGSRALPSFTNFTINNVEALLNYFHILLSRKRKLNVLRGISGIIKPSRMALLLRPPTSGKTTFLLELAGKLDSSLKRSGRVKFNGRGLEEFVPQRTAAYISQNDLHMGEMIVREALEFSGRCQGVGTRYEMLAEISRLGERRTRKDGI